MGKNLLDFVCEGHSWPGYGRVFGRGFKAYLLTNSRGGRDVPPKGAHSEKCTQFLEGTFFRCAYSDISDSCKKINAL